MFVLHLSLIFDFPVLTPCPPATVVYLQTCGQNLSDNKRSINQPMPWPDLEEQSFSPSNLFLWDARVKWWLITGLNYFSCKWYWQVVVDKSSEQVVSKERCKCIFFNMKPQWKGSGFKIQIFQICLCGGICVCVCVFVCETNQCLAYLDGVSILLKHLPFQYTVCVLEMPTSY